MTHIKKIRKCEIGIIGLGVMGKNLLLNIADHGFSVIGYDKDVNKINALRRHSDKSDLFLTDELTVFLEALCMPRVILLLIPAGHPVDAIIEELFAYLKPEDLIIDGGNSYYKDTDRRLGYLTAKQIHFMGIGISGGEEGARHGPSIMPGGTKKVYARISPILNAIAAKIDNEPCSKLLGTGSCGHFVKMVHNGIEYALMQLIAETYDLMRRGLGLNNNELSDVYQKWHEGNLNSYLLEITSNIFLKTDNEENSQLIDNILDVARQKGTGAWMIQSALELHVPIPTIDVAVAMRDISLFKKERKQLSKIYNSPVPLFRKEKNNLLETLSFALYLAMILAYDQGMSLLRTASNKYSYNIHLEDVVSTWRGGCIIRSSLLTDIKTAYQKKPDLFNLLYDPHFSQVIKKYHESLRQIVCYASNLGVPIPGLMISLSYLDAFRSSRLPANLLQAQRDYFGAHTYERVDKKGIFHTDWKKI